MREEKILIKNNALVIEALLHRASGERGAVICHPHSLMGGSMYNNVVEALQEAFASEGISTLRFNFRGVGSSTGSYSEGVGEKEDIWAAGNYLKTSGLREIFFAGYSFGAWVGAGVIAQPDHPFCSSVFVAFPIDYFEFDWPPLKNKIDLMICGDADSFCPWEPLKDASKKINALLEVIGGADHFFMGKEKKLVILLRDYLAKKNIN